MTAEERNIFGTDGIRDRGGEGRTDHYDLDADPAETAPLGESDATRAPYPNHLSKLRNYARKVAELCVVIDMDRFLALMPGELDEVVGVRSPVHLQIAAALLVDPNARERLARHAGDCDRTALAVSGRDLLTLGFEAGPAVGDALTHLWRGALDARLPDRDAQIDEAKALLARAR